MVGSETRYSCSIWCIVEATVRMFLENKILLNPRTSHFMQWRKKWEPSFTFSVWLKISYSCDKVFALILVLLIKLHNLLTKFTLFFLAPTLSFHFLSFLFHPFIYAFFQLLPSYSLQRHQSLAEQSGHRCSSSRLGKTDVNFIEARGKICTSTIPWIIS